MSNCNGKLLASFWDHNNSEPIPTSWRTFFLIYCCDHREILQTCQYRSIESKIWHPIKQVTRGVEITFGPNFSGNEAFSSTETNEVRIFTRK